DSVCISRTTSTMSSVAPAGGLITRSNPGESGLSSESVTMTAISIRASLVRSSPVISQSIHTIGFALGAAGFTLTRNILAPLALWRARPKGLGRRLPQQRMKPLLDLGHARGSEKALLAGDGAGHFDVPDERPSNGWQHEYPICQPHRLSDVVGNEQDAPPAPLPHPQQPLLQFIPGDRIERAKGLIE